MLTQRAECAVITCDKPRYRGHVYCSSHDRAFRLYGDPLVKKLHQWHGLSVRERFLKYVKQTEGCWEWLSFKDPHGYGRFSIKNKPILAHRLSWEFLCGAIPEGKQVLHKCDNPSCVNPEHLFLGDYQANTDDKMAKGRHRYGHHQGSAHPRAKLSDDDVRAIRASQEIGPVLAKRYGVTRTTIYDIRYRKIWKHLP